METDKRLCTLLEHLDRLITELRKENLELGKKIEEQEKKQKTNLKEQK